MNDLHHLSLQHLQLDTRSTWIGRGPGLLMVWVRSGHVTCLTPPNPPQVLGPGDVLAVHGTTCARFSIARGRIARLSWFLTRLEHLYPLFQGAEISLLTRVANSLAMPKRYGSGTSTARECRQLLEQVPAEHGLDHRSQLLRVIMLVLAPEISDCHRARPGNGAADERFLMAVETFSGDEFVTLAVTELAHRFGYGRRHLNRLFHKHFGVSVASIRMEMRLTKAVSLLRDPQAKIASIAAECGFNHLGLFNSCFKKRFGVSPGQWRKTKLATEAPLSATPLSLADRLRDPRTEGPGSASSFPDSTATKGMPPAQRSPASPPDNLIPLIVDRDPPSELGAAQPDRRLGD